MTVSALPNTNTNTNTNPNTNVNALPSGAALNGYVITGLIGQGGFGVVYVARDLSSNQTVAIKEYLPSVIAGRAADGGVAPRSSDLAHAYAAGLKGFLREANLLSELAHPALVAVHRAWEQNGTAYMAMAYYPGKTLREVRLSQPAVMSEAHIKLLLMPVLEAVAELHAHRIIHRDISPDNILVMANGSTVLLDLGAARQVLGGMTQALTTILKPGFAPIEQYVEDGSMEQGRWTDVYGLGAVLYFLATGKAPTPATTRIVRDTLPSIAAGAHGADYSPRFVQAVSRALAVRAIDRYKSIAELRDALAWLIVPRVAPPAERTASVEALSAEDIRQLSAPPAPIQRAPTAAPQPMPLATPTVAVAPTTGGAPSLDKLRGRGAGYQPDGGSSLLLPGIFFVVVLLIVAVLVWRR